MRKGDKMSKVTAIGTQGERVAISLDCGHTILAYPFSGNTAEAYARQLQQGMHPFVIGETRVHCARPHESEVSV